MKQFTVLAILLVGSLSINAQVKTPEEMASVLMGIGDSVHKSTLTPIEKYNRFKPIERSYLGFSIPIQVMDNKIQGLYRVEVIHKVGFYLSIPYAVDDGQESNTTLQEISYSENIATLQGTDFSSSIPLDSTFSHRALDVGLMVAPWSNHSVLKNIYISAGIVHNRSFQKVYKSNNGLIDVSGDLIYENNHAYSVSPDVGIKYVMPFAQVGMGYRFDNVYPGLYYSAGLNIPLKLYLKVDNATKEKKRRENRIKKVEKNANNYQNFNPELIK